jgi:hypothetical protein
MSYYWVWRRAQLSRANIIKEELCIQDKSFFSVYIETKNSTQMFLSEGEDKLGTLAVAMPQPKNLVGSIPSSVLLGDRNMMIARLLAELLADKTKKISMVSVFTNSVNEQEAAPILRELLEKTLENVEEES